MNAPTREHCNLCHRDVFVCGQCGKPSCIAGRTNCAGCVQARELDDASEAETRVTASAAQAHGSAT